MPELVKDYQPIAKPAIPARKMQEILYRVLKMLVDLLAKELK
jgi:hypothetical protein